MVSHDTIRIELPTILSGLGCHPKAQWHVGHGEDNYSLVLGGIVGDSAKPTFEHMVSIQERHLCRGLQPNLILGMGSKEVQGGDKEMELAGFGEFTDARAEANELFSSDIGGLLHEVFTDVEDSVFVEAQAVAAALESRALDEVLEVGAHEFVELLEDRRGLLLVQRPHSVTPLHNSHSLAQV